MEEDDKPFACSFDGCNMRFTNEDHLTVHKKKHDMVLNLGNGQKSNIFVADQTPTPTRFIRNCEEVGLFQDLQNVNPFEETFRKAVEAAKTGVGPLHEVDSLGVHTGTDDTLHTPHVFPHIIEDSTSNSSSAYKSVATSLITSTSVITENGRKNSSDDSTSPSQRRELDQLLHPTSTTEDGDCHGEMTADMLQERRIVVSTTKVVQREADTSQAKSLVCQESTRHIITTNSGNKNGIAVSALEPAIVTTPHALSNAAGNTIQFLLRTSDGKLLQLSAMTVEQVSTTGGSVLVQPTQVESQPIVAQTAAVVLTSQPAAVATLPVITTEAIKNSTTIVKTVSSPTKQSTGLSFAKMMLKQTLTNNNRTTTASKESQLKKSSPKVPASETNQTVPEMQSSSPASVGSTRRASTSSVGDESGDKRQKFLERNRAAAMRCREKRKTWIQELEKRAEEMLTTNQQLQSEVASLRAEVAQLKTLLLAHKDCPVTQAMAQGSSVPLPSGSQPHIINVTLPITTNGLLSTAQTTTSVPLVQHHTTTTPQNQLILVNGTTSLKRGSNEPVLSPKKKLNTQGSPIIRQALLLPSTQAEGIQVINSSAVKTVTSTNKSPPTSVSVASLSTVHSGVLVANPIITTPVTVAGNQLNISAVIQNSSYQTLIMPKLCLPSVVTPVVAEVGNPAVIVPDVGQQTVVGPDAQRKAGNVSVLQGDSEVSTHVIKINPNVMRKSIDAVLTTDLVANGDHDSDVEIITEVRTDSERS